jgi:hypothetical protein
MEYIFLGIAIWALVNSNHKLLFTLIVISMVAEAIRFNIVGSMLLYNVIGFLMVPFVLKNMGKLPKIKGVKNMSFVIILNVFVLLLIFGIFSPWEDLSGYRAWGQKSFGRSLITLVRLLNEFFLFYYIILLFQTKKITLQFFLKVFFLITVISFMVAIVDRVIGYKIVKNLLYFRSNLEGRFVGFNGEPKVFGRANALAFGLLLIFKRQIRYYKPLIVLTTIGTFISLSASSIIMYMVFIIVVSLYRNRKNIATVVLYLSVIGLSVVALPSVLNLIPNNYGTTDKIKQVLGADDSSSQTEWVKDESFISKKFDIFDRLALIFLTENPQYLLTGVGPNLISIPASAYIPKTAIFAEENRIDSVPNNFINNTLSTGGLIYLFVWLVFLNKIYKFIKGDTEAVLLFLMAILLNMVYFSSLMYILMAIAIGVFIQNRKINTAS